MNGLKGFLFLFVVILLSNPSFACTTFVINTDDNLVFGRNLDWVSDNGVVVVNKRNIKKTSLIFPPETATLWTSKYGSVTFNQFGKEFPFGGINEEGLVVEIMLVAGQYPNFDERTALNELQWVQYQLDNCKTIDEVVATNKSIRISKISQNLHFLVCDKYGNTSVIEFEHGKMLTYKNDKLPFQVLENDTYRESLNKYKDGSRCRFSKVIQEINNFETSEKNIIDHSFDILKSVALDGSWSIVYDVKNLEVHFKTLSNSDIRSFKLSSFDFGCDEGAKVYDLAKFDTGKVDLLFIPFNTQLNKGKFDDAIRSNQIMLPPAILRRFDAYNETCECE